MARRRELAFQPRCGKCARALTEPNCLFTTCGHLFCADGNCTKLKAGRKTRARCEQCRAQCSANTLDVVLRKDKDAQRVFYTCVEDELDEVNRKVSELRKVVQFRKKQSKTVNVVSDELNESHTALQDEIDRLNEENKGMREKIGMLGKVMAENAELRRGYRTHTRLNTQSLRTSTGGSLPQHAAAKLQTKPSLHSTQLAKDAARADKVRAPPRYPRASDVAKKVDGARGEKRRAPFAHPRDSLAAKANARERPAAQAGRPKPYGTTKSRAEAERGRPPMRKISPLLAARTPGQSRTTTFFTANTSGTAPHPAHVPPRYGRATDKTSYFEPRRDVGRRPALATGVSKPAHMASTVGRSKPTKLAYAAPNAKPKPTIGASTTLYKARAPLHDRSRSRRASSPPQIQNFASSRTRGAPGNSKWTTGTAVTGTTFKSLPPSRGNIPARAPRPTLYFPKRR